MQERQSMAGETQKKKDGQKQMHKQGWTYAGKKIARQLVRQTNKHRQTDKETGEEMVLQQGFHFNEGKKK